MQGAECGVWVMECRLWDVGCRAWGVERGVRVMGSEPCLLHTRVQAVQGGRRGGHVPSRCGVEGFGLQIRIYGLALRVRS